MALDIKGTSRTVVWEDDDADPITITSGTTWESPVFEIEDPGGLKAWSIDLTLLGGGSGIITIGLRGGNYKTTSLPAIEFDTTDLPVTDATAITTAKRMVINVSNQNMNWGQLALTASGANVTLTKVVLKYG